MTDTSLDPARRFTDQEVARILKRASDLQAMKLSSAPATGISLADLMKAANEAGLDPALVRSAAAEVQIARHEFTSRSFLGIPLTLRVERTIDGETSTDNYEAIVGEIDTSLGGEGTTATLGRRLYWRSRPGSSGATVRTVVATVTPRFEHTTISLEEDLGALRDRSRSHVFLVLFLPLTILWGSDAVSALTATVTTIAAMIGARFYLRLQFGAAVTRQAKELDALMDRLAWHARVSSRRLEPPRLDELRR